MWKQKIQKKEILRKDSDDVQNFDYSYLQGGHGGVELL